MGAYKSNVVVVIKVGAYIHVVLISMGTSYPDFKVCTHTHTNATNQLAGVGRTCSGST